MRGTVGAFPGVAGSIWNEIGAATDLLADVTKLDPGVAFVLGVAHTRGKR